MQQHLWQGPHLENDIPSPLASPSSPPEVRTKHCTAQHAPRWFHLGPNASRVSTLAKKKGIKKYKNKKGMCGAGGKEAERVEGSH